MSSPFRYGPYEELLELRLIIADNVQYRASLQLNLAIKGLIVDKLIQALL